MADLDHPVMFVAQSQPIGERSDRGRRFCPFGQDHWSVSAAAPGERYGVLVGEGDGNLAHVARRSGIAGRNHDDMTQRLPRIDHGNRRAAHRQLESTRPQVHRPAEK